MIKQLRPSSSLPLLNGGTRQPSRSRLPRVPTGLLASVWACVEIHDSRRFYDRLVRALGKQSPIQRRTYYPFETPPEGTWALPAKLAMHKEESRFSHEEEHRFVFSTKRHAFDANRVETFLVGNASARRRRLLDPAGHRRPLALGTLRECCRIIPCA